jgi:hypothetical protein
LSSPRTEKDGKDTYVVPEAVKDVYCLERDHKVEHVIILILSRRRLILNYQTKYTTSATTTNVLA